MELFHDQWKGSFLLYLYEKNLKLLVGKLLESLYSTPPYPCPLSTVAIHSTECGN